ncbi:MAG: DNA repair protein RecO [Acidiferrobacterales bacterium]|nr:DNA repair protein RecO [Acidiferrobacterales bacterium]
MRVYRQDCFVLRTTPYSESSLIVDMFTRSYGRINLLAKGARRKTSRFRGLIRPFQRLSANWSGKGNVPTLTALKCDSDSQWIESERLYCRYYLNELLIRLLLDRDPHEVLFDAYYLALERLKEPSSEFHTLRVFEKVFLQELGYALQLTSESDSNLPIDPSNVYTYDFARGPVQANGDEAVVVSGETLLSVAREEFKTKKVRSESKQLLAAVIDHYLEGKPIHSRRIFNQTIQHRLSRDRITSSVES